MENNHSARFCIVRHGETDWNAEQRIQGHQETPLNPKGLLQAEKLAHYFKGRAIDCVYSSDLLRARQTAIPIAEALNLPINLLPQLRERHYGRCEGMTRSEVASSYPEDARALHARNPDYAIPNNGESLFQQRQRTLDCLNELAQRHAGQTLLIVTHGGTLDIIYRQAAGMKLEMPRDFTLPNAGVNWLIANNERWKITYWAEVAHLESRLPPRANQTHF